MIKIILDAMGGDNAPYSTVAGAVRALKSDNELYLILTGRKAEIEGVLNKYSFDKSRLEIVDCPDVIDMNDIPTEAVKKKQSSMMTAYRLLKENEDICGFVTAGSTGAAIVGGQLILGRIHGVKRPALCAAIPNSRGGFTMLMDCGANAECKPVMLCQFALLGSAYAKAGFGLENAKVGLLNNGTEEHKGDPLRQVTFKHMSEMSSINFIGNVEGRDVMIGDCDVAVCDGFSGNVALKSMEGCAKLILGELKTQFKSSLSSKIGYLFLRKAIRRMRAKLDFDKVGGALLLGLKKPVIKSHGTSKPETIQNAIENAANTYRGNFISAVEKVLAEENFESFSVTEDENN